MNEHTPTPTALGQTLKALADPTRRAIVERLVRGEMRVTELARPFRLSLNTVSSHIRALERAGLVRRRRVWRDHWISFCPGRADEAAAWLNGQRRAWAAQAQPQGHAGHAAPPAE